MDNQKSGCPVSSKFGSINYHWRKPVKTGRYSNKPDNEPSYFLPCHPKWLRRHPWIQYFIRMKPIEIDSGKIDAGLVDRDFSIVQFCCKGFGCRYIYGWFAFTTFHFWLKNLLPLHVKSLLAHHHEIYSKSFPYSLRCRCILFPNSYIAW